MKIFFTEADLWTENKPLQTEVKKAISSAYKDVRKLLPDISRKLSYVVQANTWAWQIIPQYGIGAYALNGDMVIIFIDAKVPYGEASLLKNTYETVFHESNHTVRYNRGFGSGNNFLQGCIFEGIATVFERHRTESQPLFGDYNPVEAKQWLEEIKQQGSNINYSEYKFTHPDGRKWIAYKVGTYIVDEALRKSGKTIEEITLLDYDDIERLAEVSTR
jgi:uncharacterized protein YjaZ